MPTPVNNLVRGAWSEHRVVTGAPVAADSTNLSLINRAALLHSGGAESILVRADITAPGAADVVVEPLLYDPDTDSFAVGAQKTLNNREYTQVATAELRVFFRIATVNGAPTKVALYVMPAVTSRLA